MAFSLADYAMGNAVLGGASSVEGVLPDFSSRIEQMTTAMPPEIRARFRIISGFRSPARQLEVNPSVKNSRHSHGMALDLNNDPQVLSWINQNGHKFGVGFPLGTDPRERNHLEMVNNGVRAPLGYVPTGDPTFKSGLASTTQQPPEEPSIPYAVPADPSGDANRRAIAIALASSGAGSFGGLGGGLGSMLTKGLQPAQAAPPPSIIPTEQQLVGGALPLAKRLS